jgi:hypothetical protein
MILMLLEQGNDMAICQIHEIWGMNLLLKVLRFRDLTKDSYLKRTLEIKKHDIE